MANIYDCFSFFNEMDLLEIRLHELDPVVDYFVLVEATRTHQKQKKPLYFAENRERYQRFAAKIIHVVLDDYPNFFSRFRVPRPMDYDNHQKNQIVRGLKDAQPDDIIIYSDLDEIPRAEKVHEYKDTPGTKVFQQLLCNYYINCVAVDGPATPCEVNVNGYHYWRGSVMARYDEFQNTKEFRRRRDNPAPDVLEVTEGGWHFTYLGGTELIQAKLRSFCHGNDKNYNIPARMPKERIEDVLANGVDLFGRDYTFKFVEPDDRFPRYAVEHLDKYGHLFKLS